MIDYTSTSVGMPGNMQTVTSNVVISVFDGGNEPYRINLSMFRKPVVTFGREQDNDIVLSSPLVSRHHGRFVFNGGVWYIEDIGSANGLIYNNASITFYSLCVW